MSDATIRCAISFHAGRRGRRQFGQDSTSQACGRVPRVARFMAFAIRIDQLVATGELKNYAQAAQLGHVTRARMTQIMNLALLAADIQEELLFLPRVHTGRDPIRLADLQPIVQITAWPAQRRAWGRPQYAMLRSSKIDNEPREPRSLAHVALLARFSVSNSPNCS